jgi:hypothetical protein
MPPRGTPGTRQKAIQAGATARHEETDTNMIQYDATFEMVKARQADLRALASPQPLIPITDPRLGTIRQRFGRTLVRTGQWLQGHYPEAISNPKVATT